MCSRRYSHLILPILAFALAGGASSARAAEGAGAPLSFQVGGAQFTLGGTVELTGVLRADNTGSIIFTSFGAIPYENTAQGHLSEWRMTAQRSRLSLKVADRFGRTAVTGYMEGDFAGNWASNLFVDCNANTFRLRHYWVDVEHGPWEVLAGQAWSWATPSTSGLDPSNVFVTRNLDLALQVGLPWTRAAQFRTAYHAGGFAAGVALENPQQFIGQGEVIYPFAFNVPLSAEADAANNPGTPNALPDVLGKAAWDAGVGECTLHLEVVGLARWFRIAFQPIGASTYDHSQVMGKGAGVSVNVGAYRKLRLVASGFRGDGVGRYLGGLGPDFVAVPSLAPMRVSLSTVHAQSFLFGAELDLPGANGLAAYYGREDFGRRSFLDSTNPVPNRYGGFGGPNSPNSANRTLHQVSVDVSHTFWSSPEHGSFALLGQFSEVFRQPWYAAPNSPNRALVDMAFLEVRYALP